jgi:hypothetical protein
VESNLIKPQPHAVASLLDEMAARFAIISLGLTS